MSLGVAIKGPEGLVLAADSRVTLSVQHPNIPPLQINFDNATKLLSFTEPPNFAGAVTYGTAVIELRTARSFIPELEEKVLETKQERLTVEEYAGIISTFFQEQWHKVMPEDHSGPPMTFIVAGYGPDDAYGRVYLVNIPFDPDPVEQNPGETNFGMTWGGQLSLVSRLIHGYDPALPAILQKNLEIGDEEMNDLLQEIRQSLEFQIPYQVLPLQDCVDLATLLMRTTMDAQKLAVTVRGVGGLMELAVITRTHGLDYIQRKSITINER